MLAAPCITYEYGAVPSGLEHAHALGGDAAHLLSKLVNVMHARQVALAVVRVRDDAGVGRMRGYEVRTENLIFIRTEVKISSVRGEF